MTSQIVDMAGKIFIQAAAHQMATTETWAELAEECHEVASYFYHYRKYVEKEKTNASDN